MADHLKDKIILITGGGSGFGRLVATKAAARGARIVVSDIAEDTLAETVAMIEKGGGEALGVRADVTDRADMRGFAAQAFDHFGAIDVLVNNAGVMPLAFFADHEDADAAWDLCIDINLKGVLHGISAVHDIMIEQGRGHVVNISSIYGNGPVPGAAVYGATKAAVRFMSEALRQESQGTIKVTTIRPTGVPSTALGNGIINPAAIGGVLGAGMANFMEKMGEVFGENPPKHLTDPEQISYFALSAELLADQIILTIDQPWGVSISDLTVRASGDSYML